MTNDCFTEVNGGNGGRFKSLFPPFYPVQSIGLAGGIRHDKIGFFHDVDARSVGLKSVANSRDIAKNRRRIPLLEIGTKLYAGFSAADREREDNA